MKRHPSNQEIRSARKIAGLTQSEASALVHCSIRSWQMWEEGRCRMHPGLWELFLIKTGQNEDEIQDKQDDMK